MDWDGWAISVGESTCRYLSTRGHDGLARLFCSEGAYSAGWRIFAAVLAIAVISYVFVKFARPGA